MRIPSYQDHGGVRDNQALTPLIDCVFLLLVFFLCASVGRFREDLLATELSGGTISSEQAVEIEKPFGEVWVRLKRENQQTTYEINDRRYAIPEQALQVLKALAQVTPEIPVILDIEPDVPAGDMITAYDVCRAANFHSIRFAADASSVPPSNSNGTTNP